MPLSKSQNHSDAVFKGSNQVTNDQLEKILSHIHAIKQKIGVIKLSLGLKIVFVGILLLVIGYNLFFVYVQPNEYGIKVVRLGLNRGVQKEVYHAGLSFVLPFGFQQMYRLEVSGILKGSKGQINQRLKEKVEQTKKSDNLNLPAYVVIVEFSQPLVNIRKR